VTVTRDESVTVDFSEYTASSAATQMGLVNFSVVPSSAVMTIDGVETDYSQPVTLSYGTHKIVLSAHNYEQYTETITVNQSYATKVIDMVSTSSTTSSSTTTSKTTKASSNTATTPADLTDGYTVNITEPEGAALYVDSVYIGIVPCSFDKNSGNKTITLTQSGYDTVSYTIAIANTAGNLTYAFPAMQQTTSDSQ
jgi:activator of HSP90 ATPase